LLDVLSFESTVEFLISHTHTLIICTFSSGTLEVISSPHYVGVSELTTDDINCGRTINSTLPSSAAVDRLLSAAAVLTRDVVACLITHSNSTSSLGHSSSPVMATRKIAMLIWFWSHTTLKLYFLCFFT